ncbi:actin-related protein 5 isoform X2 [Dendrobium catenatum]|uniref:Actin-related protein 5 n=1 Tax=Dendrobium catenatum TaxID=906689 RepID=A0A2I0VXP7_9ASPA|nr:actin-related protein 5 isoform X2 [Dendrobium catenatum]PKU68176.1 Actin-related protein 5 [Dendrobium catenatum]
MPSLATRPERQTDYRRFSPAIPIIIDNGGFNFRIGWAGESDPRITFRNLVYRPRHKATGETVTIVGDHDPVLLKYFDCTRSSYRSAFDSNVVYQFEIMEYVLDYGFDRLGVEDSPVDHPILMTECICNPISSRSKMAELLFETYGVPSLAFGVDAAFAYKFNQQHGICSEDGLAICSGFATSHVIPFVEGEPVLEACCRTNVGGYHVTDYLKQLLSLNYPYHISSITWEKAEELKLEHCYVAYDYAAELQLFQKGTKEAEEKTRCWQLPWIPPSQEDAPSEEELARKAALKEKQGQRLRDIAAAKKFTRISELEHKLHGLEDLVQQLDEVEDEEMYSILSVTDYNSKQEIESAVHRVTQSLRKARGEPCESEEKVDASLSEKYPLISIPDDMLTPEQLKEKKKQIFLKTTSEGRLRAKQKKFKEELLREKQNQEDEEKRLENPELYLEQTRVKYRELCERVDQRKRLKTNGNGNSSGGVGRGERLNSVQKERMRLLTTAAFDRGKGEDTFGARDEDWQLYKLMSRDNDDDDDSLDEDETELSRVTTRLQEIDPEFVAKSDLAALQGTLEFTRLRPLTAEDFKINLGIERFRCPEILFQPSMVGVDQAGLDEMTGVSLRRLSSKDDAVKNRMCNSIIVLGGSSLFPGLDSRLEAGIRQIRPYLSPLKVVRSLNPVLDAWRGAAAYATSMQFSTQTFSIQDYYEKGESGLKQYQIKYSL